jgi:hypothetical protein
MTSITLSFTGKARYLTEVEGGHGPLLVSVHCRIHPLEVPLLALLDTAAPWCVLRADLAEALGYDAAPDPDLPRLSTRFGLLPGRLERLPVVFVAEEGEDVEVEATWFISSDWPGPVVIGWKGCLERLRLALDPSEEAFYFGPL